MEEEKRALLISSGGGHWVQMRRLESAFDDWELHYACTDAGQSESVPVPTRFYVCPEASQWTPVRLFWQLANVVWLMVRIRPSVVLSTGASVGVFAIALGRILGAHTIWLDSIANADEMSLSGGLAGRFSHLWLTQWEHLARPGGPYYMGAVV